MKTIKIAYEDIRDDWENSVLNIYIDAPKYQDKRMLYFYELFYFDKLMKKIQEEQIQNLKYGMVHLKYTPMFIKVDDKTFKELKNIWTNKQNMKNVNLTMVYLYFLKC